MGSALVAVRSGLIAGLDALADFDGVLVEFGYKVGAKNREKVWTQDARFTHKSASLRAGKTFRNEVGTFNLRILVEGVGKSPEWTSTRAMALGHAAEQFVALHANWNDGALGVAINALTIEGDGELVEAFNDKGSLAELTYPIRFTARLT
jgi:hypothetical protein